MLTKLYENASPGANAQSQTGFKRHPTSSWRGDLEHVILSFWGWEVIIAQPPEVMMRMENEVMYERAQRARIQSLVLLILTSWLRTDRHTDRQAAAPCVGLHTAPGAQATLHKHELWPLSRTAMLHWGHSLRRRCRAEENRGKGQSCPGRVRGPREGVAASAQLLRDDGRTFRSRTAHSPSSASGGRGSTGLPTLGSREFAAASTLW